MYPVKQIDIQVTQSNINNASHCSWGCPIARALYDIGARKIRVLRQGIGFDLGLVRYKAAHTRRSKDFIDKFDANRTVKPAKFRFKPVTIK